MSSGSPRPLLSSMSLPMIASMSSRLITRLARGFGASSAGSSILSFAATSPSALFSL